MKWKERVLKIALIVFLLFPSIARGTETTWPTGSTLIFGTTQWDNGSDKIDGEVCADNTIDDDSIDFSSDNSGDTVSITDMLSSGPGSGEVPMWNNTNWIPIGISGRSLTVTNDEVSADSELYVYKVRFAFENPVTDDDFFFDEIATNATATSIYCKTLVGTVDLDVQIAGVDINGTDITCDTSGVLDSSLGGDTDLNVGEEIKLAITSVASSPTYLMVIVNGTYDD